MIPVNMPDAPPSSAMLPVLFVQADASMMNTVVVPGKTLTVGRCVVYSSSTAPDDTPYGSGPVAEAAMALNRVFGRKMIDLDKPVKAEVTVVAQPKQGKLILNKFPDGGTTYDYRSNIGYLGKETFTLLVKIEGQPPVKIIYFFTIVKGGPDDVQIKQYCGTTKIKFWKISESESFEKDALSNIGNWQRNAELSALLANASRSLTGFSDLASTALGESTGEGLTAQITLDQNAAGHNWYIDPTPLDNSDDYLPTSDPTVWKAKAGSAAEGKMDVLSVLLHEYGHALGLEHSGAASDFMAASLQPGVRKLPSAAELTLMSQLVAELKGAAGDALTPTLSQWESEQDPSNPFAPSPLSALGLLPFGLMRRNDGKGAANAALTAATATQTDYLTAINTTLTNGSFSAGQNGTIDQWESIGNVAATPAVAFHAVTLGESTTAQAHLAQAFILSAQDRFLTFTVSGLNLQTNSIEQNGVFTAAPQDAFEVALQNANTGANLLADGAGGVGNYLF